MTTVPWLLSHVLCYSGKPLFYRHDLYISLHPPPPAADEIDAIAPKRESAQREMERRIVAQLLTCMDDLTAAVEPSAEDESEVEKSEGPAMGKHVIVIGAERVDGDS